MKILSFQEALLPPVGMGIDLDDNAAVERIGDRSIYLEIAHYFGSHMQQSLAFLAEALEKADSENATRLAHSLKGNCATVGAETMRSRCHALEKLCRDGKLDEAQKLFTNISPHLLELGAALTSLE
ncbi:Hpt domain-containing protein [Desulfovibrio sp. OttesenSCG-928-G15]|nr:Hpt domain-containing protein [Desulfovibrio sp. OttesenSCG-928-G15]